METPGPSVDMSGIEYVPLPNRGITMETCRKYGYGVLGGEQYAPYYTPSGGVAAYKVRGADKKFRFEGKPKGVMLFGQQLARSKGRQIVITEGEIDALAVSQALGNTWPVLSLISGAASAPKDIGNQIEFLEGYERVVLAFDNDKPGQEAIEKCVSLFSPGKVHVAKFGVYKDAGEMLVAEGGGALRSAIWDAKEWRPDGVVNLADCKDIVSASLELGTQYPWVGLNKLLYGFRPQELITWTAGTGTGKTAVVSELVYSLIVDNNKRVGIVYLEEGIARAGRRIVGLHMNKPLHLPNVVYEDAEFDAAWEVTLGTGNLVAYDHFGSLDEDILMLRLRHMIKAQHCEVIVLDHISMVVSGAAADVDERRTLDRIMTSLRSLTQETGATIHVVSHLRRPQGSGSHEEGMAVSLSHLRGTQAIAQLSDAVIALERDQQADSPVGRNTTTLRVLKNRYSGMTGVAGALVYDPKTGRLKETSVDDAFNAPEWGDL